jgi:hypothetical protein
MTKKDCLTLEDETNIGPETSVANHQSTLRNIPEELKTTIFSN